MKRNLRKSKKIKQTLLTRSLLKIFYVLPICALPFCSSQQESPLESMAQPIILKVKNDSLVEVEDRSGNKYALNTHDRVKYYSAFMQVGDTIQVSSAE